MTMADVHDDMEQIKTAACFRRNKPLLYCRPCYGVICSHNAWNAPGSTSKKTGALP